MKTCVVLWWVHTDMKVLIDLRTHLLPVRDQKTRPTCMAFAASASHECKHGLLEHLSPEHLYQQVLHKSRKANGQGLNFNELPYGLNVSGQTTEAICPYDVGWKYAPAVQLQPVYKTGCVDDLLPFGGLVAQLSENRVPIVGFVLTRAFHARLASPFIIDDSITDLRGRHAMNIVGHAQDGGSDYLLLRNSWGTGWGDQGYAWISRKYYEQYAERCLFLQ